MKKLIICSVCLLTVIMSVFFFIKATAKNNYKYEIYTHTKDGVVVTTKIDCITDYESETVLYFVIKHEIEMCLRNCLFEDYEFNKKEISENLPVRINETISKEFPNIRFKINDLTISTN